jgi:CHAT domain-containing protein/tetratricopeptide (TPR) repeat protein
VRPRHLGIVLAVLLAGAAPRSDFEKAEALAERGRWDRAYALASAAEAASPAAGDEERASRALAIGRYAWGAGLGQDAVSWLTIAVEAADRADPAGTTAAQAHRDLGVLLATGGQLAASRPHLEAAARAGASDAGFAASVGTELGVVCRMLGDLPASREALAQALVAARTASDPRAEAMALLHLGSTEAEAGRFDLAAAAHQRALGLAEALTPAEPALVGQIANALAIAALESGDAAAAQEAIDRARDIEATLRPPDPGRRASVLNNVARVAEVRGDVGKARAAYEEALALLHPDDPAGATLRYNLAGLLADQGDADAAEALVTRAIAQLEPTGGPELARALRVLAQVRAVREDGPGVREAEARARDILVATLGPEHPVTLDATETLAALELRLGRTDVGLAMAREVVAARERNGDPDLGASLVALGLLEVGAGLDASATWARALEVSGDRGPVATSAHWIRGWVALKSGDPAAAEPDLARALADAAERTRLVLGATSDRERLRAVAAPRPVVDAWIALRLSLGDARGAWEASLAWKGLAGRASLGPAASRRDPAVARWREELEVVRGRIAEAAFAGGADPALTAEKERLEREIAAYVRIAEPPRAEAVLAALPEDGALVDWLRFEDLDGPRYAAFVARPDGSVTVALSDAAAVDVAVSRYRREVDRAARTTRSLDAAAAEVRALVWDPVAPRLGSGPVALSPDGELARVAFSGLPTADGRYLVEDHLLVWVDSPAELARLDAAVPRRGALLVGDVDYGEADGASCIGPFAELPGTAAELKKVASHLPEGTVATLRGAGADELSVRRGFAGAGVVHFATHGFFAPTCARGAPSEGTRGVKVVPGAPTPGAPERPLANPMVASGVALAGANDGARSGDGLLTAEEVAGLDLTGTELVVLSACDTGLGAVEAGEGVLGLRRAFSWAGARRVVTSFWQVEDEPTVELMDRLYAARAAGASPAVALREAELALLAEARASGDAKPWTWAAFAVSGGF